MKKLLELILSYSIIFFLVFFIDRLFMADYFAMSWMGSLLLFLCLTYILLSIPKIHNFKIYAILLAVSTAFAFISDAMNFYHHEVSTLTGAMYLLLVGLFIVPNISLVAFLTLFLMKNVVHWNKQQLLVDILFIGSNSGLIVWSFLFADSGTSFLSDTSNLLATTYIFLDLFAIMELVLIFVSKGLPNLKGGIFSALLGISIFSIMDALTSYSFLYSAVNVDEYITTNPLFIDLIDSAYIFCTVIFAFACARIAKFSSPISSLKAAVYEADESAMYENVKSPRKWIFVMLIPYYLLLQLYIFNLYSFFLAVFIVLSYWIMTSGIQINSYDKLLLKIEKENTVHLEDLVVERTKELEFAYQQQQKLLSLDSLSGLRNRRSLIKYLDNLLISDTCSSIAVLYIDINRFKLINDAYGHEVGDGVLKAVGYRFANSYPEPLDAFHVSSDEFVVAVVDNNDKEYLSKLAGDLLDLINEPIHIAPYTFFLTASIGIALYPEDATDRDSLLKYADTAMYESKATKKQNYFAFFDQNINKKFEKLRDLELMLQKSDYDREFVLYYQPQYCAETETLNGMEALIRWFHPEKGLISPVEFIPVAERSGMIIDIGLWVTRRAMSQIKEWNEKYGLDLRMGINLSTLQLESDDFIDRFKARLIRENISPEWIELEITESVAMDDSLSSINIFGRLADIGISVAIDDFGTGYSSLSYIKRYSIDRLKIAKELIDAIETDEISRTIVRAIIMMAEGMRLNTIAEGVEHRNQLELLKVMGCDDIQGYFFGKPVPPEEFEEMHIKKLVEGKH